jgi:thymidylate synthase
MIVKELLWFLRGQTDSKILEAQGVNIWRDNSTREFLDKRGLSHLREGDIGEMYGICLRSYGCDYQGCDHDYLGKGFDQITNLIQGLKEDPFSRRHILTTYNPGRVHNCALYPCHGVAIMFYVTEKSGKLCLSCHMVQRSADTVLGLPTNIASYALLTHIIAKKTDMQPDELIISFGDAHVYRNHFDQVKCQIERSPLPYPVVEVSDSVKDKDFKDINVDDFTLCCYLYHPKIAAPMAI